MSAIDIIVDLPPPDPNEAGLLDLSPSAYIQHPDTVNLLRQKRSLPIGPETQRNSRLESPPIEDDRTILNYYDRVHRSVFKEEISVRLPDEAFVYTMNKGKVNLIHF